MGGVRRQTSPATPPAHLVQFPRGGWVRDAKRGGCVFCTGIKPYVLERRLFFPPPSGSLLSFNPDPCREPGTFKCTCFSLKQHTLSAIGVQGPPCGTVVTWAPTLVTLQDSGAWLPCLFPRSPSHCQLPLTQLAKFFSKKIDFIRLGREASLFPHLPLCPFPCLVPPGSYSLTRGSRGRTSAHREHRWGRVRPRQTMKGWLRVQGLSPPSPVQASQGSQSNIQVPIWVFWVQVIERVWLIEDAAGSRAGPRAQQSLLSGERSGERVLVRVGNGVLSGHTSW